jgi:protocatechuate 3,4-dioxygenase beta subunit
MKLSVLMALLVAAAFLAAGSSAAPRAFRCQPTAQDGFGPFGRGSPPLRSSIGRGHVLTGTVLSALDCSPLRSARVELWQEDKTGTYRPAGSATVVTDRSGRFRFEGPVPPSGSGFPGHIHLRVLSPGYKPLLTRYVLSPGERSGSVKLVLEPDAL